MQNMRVLLIDFQPRKILIMSANISKVFKDGIGETNSLKRILILFCIDSFSFEKTNNMRSGTDFLFSIFF